jgi:hypothetical protein
MDILAHALYGATVCSRTGLAGGAAGAPGSAGHQWTRDWTVWVAALFGILPDIVALGPPLLAFVQAGMPGNFFRDVGGGDLVCYRYMHSLIVAFAVAGLLRLTWKPLFIPALAWPLHVAMDALTHGAGKFHTTIVYPFSTWGFDSIRWWQHPEIVLAYWLLLPVIWFSLRRWRRRAFTYT